MEERIIEQIGEAGPDVIRLEARDKMRLGFRMPMEPLPPQPAERAGASPRETAGDMPEGRVRKLEAKQAPRPKLRTAAYCRVSTLSAAQEGSIEAQQTHFARTIRENPRWELADIYLEAGVTGTQAEIRPQLQRLLADCRAGRIDLVLTKSISRFARNTADCLDMVRRLTSLGVDIYFEKERIHTGEMGSELILSVLASLAQDESRSISQNLKWSIRRRFAQGTYQQAVLPYGYDRADGQFIIVPEEAAVVRRIFGGVLSGRGMASIAGELNEAGIPTRRGNRWTEPAIRQIIHNPAYMGDMLFQKTYTDEHYAKCRNTGALDRYYVEEHHPPIIGREAFRRAAGAVRQRGRESGTYASEENAEQAARRQNRTALSGRMYCALCGAPMHRQRKKYYHVYICSGHRRDPEACGNRPELEDSVKNVFLTCLNKLAYSQGLSARYRLLDRYRGRLEEQTDGGRNGVRAEETDALRRFIGRWEITDAPDAFPEAEFPALVERVDVSAGVSAAFVFRCGLRLTESLEEGA